MRSVTQDRARLGLSLGAVVIACVLLLPFTSRAHTPGSAAKPASGKVALYASVGSDLTEYDLDVESGTLVKRDTVTVSGNIQYACTNPTGQYLYVVWSENRPHHAAPGADAKPSGNPNGLTVFRIDPASGALQAQGETVPLSSRPIYLTTDTSGANLLVAFNKPSLVTVYRISPNGALTSQVDQPAGLDFGIFAHQVRVTPSNKAVIVVTKGNAAVDDKPADPGALKIFGYDAGVLTRRTSIAPDDAFKFSARAIDFHPSRPWAFVSLERENKLLVYKMLEDGSVSPAPLFAKDSLTDPSQSRPGQAAGMLLVHPNGKFVYQANRSDRTVDFEGKPVFAGGVNAIAVYAINQHTGEPTLIQNIDTQGISPRSFALDPSGRILVAANQVPLSARDGNSVSTIPSSLVTYKIGHDGKLEFVHKYDVEATSSKNLFWIGIVPLP